MNVEGPGLKRITKAGISVEPPADAVRAFQHDNLRARRFEQGRRMKPRKSCADDNHIGFDIAARAQRRASGRGKRRAPRNQ